MPASARRYVEALARRPFATRVLTTALSVGAGDAVCQLGVERRRLEPVRTLRAVALGLLLVGPGLYAWHFHTLPRLLSAADSPLRALAADQLLFAPLLLGAYLFAVDFLRVG